MNKPTCCELCLCGMEQVKHRMCHDSSCPCHTTTPQTDGWEARWDSEINEDFLRGGTSGANLVGIKTFIKSLLAAERSTLREKIKGIYVSKPDREEELAAYTIKNAIVEEMKFQFLSLLKED